MIESQMKHLNYNAFCSIMIETTGDNGREHDIVEICVVLLDNFAKPSPTAIPFTMQIQPFRPENIDYDQMNISKVKLKEIMINGVEPSLAADRLAEWFYELGLKRNKRIIPLTHDWPRCSEFLKTWLGYYNYNSIFGHEYRDLQAMCWQINDRKNFSYRPYPFPKTDMAYIANQCKVDYTVKMDVMEKTIRLPEIYKRILMHFHIGVLS
jgi:hypothetical protein